MSEYAGRLIKSEWSVRPVNLAIGQRLTQLYHYAAGGSNTATYMHGLFRAGELFDLQCLGLAWWIPPTKSAAQATYPENWQGVLCLTRLVILPDVPKNAATFLLARSVKLIDRSRWPCLVTYADTWRGHSGGIYRASNWEYKGMTKPESVYTLNGRMIARKAGPHTRTNAEMLALGCKFEGRYAKHKFIQVR